jgi:zinc protease
MIALLLFNMGIAHAQSTAVKKQGLKAIGANGYQLPLDPALKQGKLINGFTYYIQKNTEPKNRATLYLVVKAGSILETDEQRGLAHFMEHMSFNGTKHFPKNELVNYLQKSGIRFGADLNAYTGFDETVYQLPIPTDNAEILRNGMQIMRDWAQDASLDPDEINSERGVVLEEKRLRMGASQRIQDQVMPGLLNYSKYVQRMPIGVEQVLKNFSAATITSFYKDWYRPNLQALIVVGDVDPAAIEVQVKKLFSDLKNPAIGKKRTDYAIKLDGKRKFRAVTDPEISQTSIEIAYKFNEQPVRTEADFRNSLMKGMFSDLFAARLAESSKKADRMFLSLSGGYSTLMGGLEALMVQIQPKKGELKAGFDAFWMEITRIKRYGFTQKELERAKQNMLSAFEAAWQEKDKQSSTKLADAYKDHFLKGEAVPGIAKEYQLAQQMLPKITLSEINSMVVGYIKNTDRDITIVAPETEKANLPAEADLMAWIKEVESKTINLYTEAESTTALMTNLPVRGKVIAEQVIPEIGVTEWTLSNGAKVVLKPTTFKNDEVNFLALSEGGTSLYSDADYESAANAPGMITSFGLGAFDNIALPKMLNGKNVKIMPFLSDRVEGFQGSSVKKDLETSMQLLYLYFTQPRKDTALFNTIIRNSAQRISARYSDPKAVFADTVSAVLGNYSGRKTGPTLKKLESIDLDKMMRIYKERFADAGDFTFFFVGNFNADSLKFLTEQYIAALPALGIKESPKDLGIHIPEGVIAKTVKDGKEDQATVRMVFSGDYAGNDVTNLKLLALKEILQFRLLERLREKEGGVYTPSVQMNHAKYPASRYSFTVNFGCAPANVEKLITATLDEMAKLKKDGILSEDLEKFKAEQLRQNELLIKDNSFWLNYLAGQYLDQEDPAGFLKQEALIKKLNMEELQVAAKQYFNEQNYIRFVLLPKV